jgi:hypothetical protein
LVEETSHGVSAADKVEEISQMVDRKRQSWTNTGEVDVDGRRRIACKEMKESKAGSFIIRKDFAADLDVVEFHFVSPL